jgi:hypothetical protein
MKKIIKPHRDKRKMSPRIKTRYEHQGLWSDILWVTASRFAVGHPPLPARGVGSVSLSR